MAYYGFKPAEQAIQIGDNTIVSADIADGSIVNADLNSSAAIAMSKTQLVAGTGITLATNTLNVDAAQTQITSVGTLTGLTIENATNPLIVGDGTKKLFFDPDSNGVMVSTATSQGGDGHYYNDASGEVWTTIDGTAKVKVKASAFEVTPNATFSGDIRTIGTGVRTIRLESTTNAQNLNLDFFNNANAIAGRITYQEGAGAFYFQPNQAGGGTALTLDWSNNATFAGDVNVSGQKIRISNSSTNAKIEIDSGGGHDAWIDIAKGSVNWTIQNTGALSFRHEGSEKMNLTSAGDVTFGGRLYTTDGSASYPSYSFSSDSNTGMYLGTADTLRFATGGVERLEITSAQTKVTGDFITTGGIQSKGTNGNNPTGDWYDVKQKFLTYEHDVTPTHVNDGYFSVSHGISRGNILGVIPHHYGYGGTNVNNFGITSGFVEKVIMYANATLRVYIGSSVVASDKIYLTMIVEGNTG